MSSSGGGVLRAGIPTSLRSTIQDIKEIATKHSDDDIYLMLKECNMDPNETVQKLLYLDTFHEVKKKRDKKKSSENVQASERHRFTSSMQHRGARGGRGSHSSTYLSNDAGGRQEASPGQENGRIGHVLIGSDLLVPVHQTAQNDTAAFDTNSSNGSARITSLSSGSSVSQYAAHLSADEINNTRQVTSAPEVNKLRKSPALPSGTVKQLQTSTPGPTSASTLAKTFTIVASAGFDGRNSESGELLTSSAPVSGVYSSASDDVVLPSFNPWNPGAVGKIKHETGSLRTVSEFTGSQSRLSTGQDSVHNGQVAPRTLNFNSEASQGAERSQPSEPAIISSLLNHDSTSAAISHQDGWSDQQVSSSSNEMTEDGAIVSLEADVPSLHQVNDSDLEQETSQLNRTLAGLNQSSHHPVVFPDHIQVPEAYRSGLTFGSLDGAFGLSDSISKDANLVEGTALVNQDASREPSLSHETVQSTSLRVEYSGHHPQPFPAVPENLSPLEVTVTPVALPIHELSKPEIMPPIGGSPFPFLHTSPDYGFGIVPPMLGPHLVQVEGAEVSNSSVPSTSDSSQTATHTVGVSPNSVALPTQLFPFLRQPYLPNYIPYNPYFAHLYMPPNAHQFLGHNGFPQQSSTGNLYIPPQAAATAAKFPIPSMYKSGSIAANLTHFGIPSGYGSYGSSAPGYGLSATTTPSSSSSIEDITAPELKEKNMHSVLKQNEDSHVWTSLAGRDLSSLQANSFYNIPQGQQVIYPPAYTSQGSFAGMYHLTPTTATPSVIHSLPQHSQGMVGSIDSVAPPSSTYQQPHSQLSWNSKLLNRESI